MDANIVLRTLSAPAQEAAAPDNKPSAVAVLAVAFTTGIGAAEAQSAQISACECLTIAQFRAQKSHMHASAQFTAQASRAAAEFTELKRTVLGAQAVKIDKVEGPVEELPVSLRCPQEELASVACYWRR